MTCVHNQVIIDGLNAEKAEYITLKDDVTKMKTNHEEFNINLSCVISNLANNNVVAGQAYDNGDMQKYYKQAENVIAQCEEIIKECTTKINDLDDQIKAVPELCYACANPPDTSYSGYTYDSDEE